jgi:hypothetical protein
LAILSLVGLFLVAVPVAQAVSCLIFPLSCLKPKKKYGEEVEAKILGIGKVHTDVYMTTITSYGSYTYPDLLENTREFYVSFQVGQTRYMAWKKDTVVQMAGMLGGYNPKREEWVGKTVKMRFMDETDFGLIKAPVAVFKTPKGKDWQLVVVSIVGADGVDECPPAFGFKQNLGHCALQGGIDRGRREDEIAAKLQAQGKRPLWDTLDLESAKKIVAARESGEGGGDAAAVATAAVAAPAAAQSATPSTTSGTACAVSDDTIVTAIRALDGANAPGDAAAKSIDKWVQDNATGGAACADYHFVAADAAAIHRDWAAMQAAYLRGISMSNESYEFASMMDRDIFRAAAPDGNRENYFNQVKTLEPPLPADYFQWFDPVLTAAIDKWGSSDAALQKLRARVTKP